MAATLTCLRGKSAKRDVLLGFAPAKLLHALSFADILDEQSGRGYQRRFNAHHSLDFRRYIQGETATTIPLTFNLRPSDRGAWRLDERPGSQIELTIEKGAKALAQVDCQHRLGYLADLDLALPFMTFIGLSEREEMEIFGVINGKAKGLSPSLLDFHDAQLCQDLAADRPELLVALFLKNEPTSPWHNRLDLGGTPVSGLDRRASLRTMQKASKIFLRRTRFADPESAARAAHEFWYALATVIPSAFSNPRSYLVTKGIGVYALMEIAADIVNELPPTSSPNRTTFAAILNDFVPAFDWSGAGPLRGLGGEGGVAAAVALIRGARRASRLRVAHG